MNILIYGLQRSGTNLLEQILIKYFNNVHILNNNQEAKNPLHKHFRPHSFYTKIHSLYRHKFSIDSFDSFVSYLPIIPDHYIIVSKDPYSWFLSYSNWAKNNPKQYHAVDFHFSEEYELFYSNWIHFSSGQSNIHYIKYIDLLNDPNNTIKQIADKISVQIIEPIKLPSKVPYSNNFTEDKIIFYKDKLYLNYISDYDKQIISQTVTSDTFMGLGYNCIT